MNAAIDKVFFMDGKNKNHSTSKRIDFLSGEELSLNIQRCVLNDRLSQKRIYTSFYSYAMTICSLYTCNYDDSVEILNDGFLKVFKEMHRYQPAYANVILSFKGWLRKIIVYTAIDHFRKNRKYRFTSELNDEVDSISADDEDALDRISYNEIVESMQKLTPGYRIIFNLFILENLSHEEISQQLGISIGTSKSNLCRGRKQLQKLLFHHNQIKYPKKIAKAVSSREFIEMVL